MWPGLPVRMTHDYVRHGTTSLIPLQLRETTTALSAAVDDSVRGRACVISRHGKPEAFWFGYKHSKRPSRVPSLSLTAAKQQFCNSVAILDGWAANGLRSYQTEPAPTGRVTTHRSGSNAIRAEKWPTILRATHDLAERPLNANGRVGVGGVKTENPGLKEMPSDLSRSSNHEATTEIRTTSDKR